MYKLCIVLKSKIFFVNPEIGCRLEKGETCGAYYKKGSDGFGAAASQYSPCNDRGGSLRSRGRKNWRQIYRAVLSK